MKTYIFGNSMLDLKYTDSELHDIIISFFKQKPKASYLMLCNFIVALSDKNNMFVKGEDTIYSNCELSEKEHDRINVLLWEMIWDKKLLINFRTPKYGIHHNNDTYFIYKGD